MSEIPEDPYLRKEYFTVQLYAATTDLKEALAGNYRGEAEDIVKDRIMKLPSAYLETLEIAVRGAGVEPGGFLGSDYHKILESAGLIWSTPSSSYWPTPMGTFVYECMMLLKAK